MTPQDLLHAAAESRSDDPARPLLIAAAIAAVTGRQVVLVGGSAVNLHTGSYRPTHIDLVVHLTPADHQALEDLALTREGRHYHYDTPGGPILIEFPGDQLHPLLTTPPELIEVAPGVIARAVALDDLMIDRALQATDGTPVTFDEALRLAVAAYRRINWDDLTRRATAAGQGPPARAIEMLPDTLERIRRSAVRQLRNQQD